MSVPESLKTANESQLIEYATRMRKDRDRLQLVVDQAVTFLDNRRRDGIDFPYDSRPLRKLKDASSK